MSSPTQIARRYAEALADSAAGDGDLAGVAAELHAFTAMVEANKDLHTVFASPVIQADDKKSVLDAILELARPAPVVASLLRVLQQNDRLPFLSAVDKAFAREVDRRLGVVSARVTTAAPLSDGEQKVLLDQLEKMTGQRVKLSFETDEELIGGVVTRIGSLIYDGSVRAKLDTIKRQMTTGS